MAQVSRRKKRARSTIKKKPAWGLVGVTSRQEVKFVDTSFAATVSTTSQIQLINAIAVGADGFNRIGKRVTGKYVEIRASFQSLGIVNTSGMDTVHVALVYDRQNQGVTPSYGEIFTGVNNAGGSIAGFYAPQNPNNMERFMVLHRSYHVLSPQTFTFPQTPHGGSLVINKRVNLKNLNTSFSTSGATASDISGGSLYICWVSSTNVSSSSTWQLYACTRYAYCD